MLRALRPLLAKAPAATARPLRPLGVSARNYAAQSEPKERKPFTPVQTTSVEECVDSPARA